MTELAAQQTGAFITAALVVAVLTLIAGMVLK